MFGYDLVMKDSEEQCIGGKEKLLEKLFDITLM
jgi:hypothetical protein